MAIPGSRVPGKHQKVRLNGTTVYSAKATVLSKFDKHDITSGEDLGFGTWAIGVHDAEVTVEGFVDIGTALVSGQYTSGAVLTNVIIYPYAPAGVAPSGSYWTFPLFVAEEFEVGAEVRGVVSLRIKGNNQGTYTPPTGI